MRKRILAIVLALTIFMQLTGCSKKENKQNIISSELIETTIEIETEEETEFDLKQTEDNYLNINYMESEYEYFEDNLGYYTNISDFLEELAGIEINYNYPEFYFNKNDYQEVLKVLESKQECDNLDKNISLEEVYKTLLENSNILTIEKELYQDKDDVLISETLKEALDKCYEHVDDIGDDFCKLMGITIKVAPLNEEGVLGQFDAEQNLLVIDYDEIKKSYTTKDNKENISFRNYLVNTIRHELNHVKQFICDCRKEKGQKNLSIAYTKEQKGFILESSAESQLYNKNIDEIKLYSSTFDYTYLAERQSQALMLLMGIFKKDFSLEKYYDAINNSDLEALCNLYELNTYEDFKNFYDVFYALSSLNYRTDLFEHLCEDGYYTISNIENNVGNDYKIAIFKMVVRDLIDKINSENLTLGESLRLYNFVKANIVSDEDEMNLKSGDRLCYYNDKFIKGIGAIDDIFYKFISDYYLISKNKIDDIENDFVFKMDLDYLCSWQYDGSEYIISKCCEYMITKYPLIQEISFCNLSFYTDIEDFDKARENNLTIERLKNK